MNKPHRKRICVITGSRAEYGLLYSLLKKLDESTSMDLSILATGMHLSPRHGETYRVIEEDGFTITRKVEMPIEDDSPVSVAKSLGIGAINFAECLEELSPDLIIILGDRVEVFSATQAAMLLNIPIAHISGGDTTEGAIDEAIRHSLTKMAHLHFVTNEQALTRVRQLGEDPENIFLVGNPGLDLLEILTLYDRQELEKTINFQLRERNILVTFHPATLDEEKPASQFKELLSALDDCGNDVGIIFTRPNSDAYGGMINNLIDDFTSGHTNSCVHTSLGQIRYLSVLRHVDMVVGNSSSGILEAPSFNIPTVNIGDRQKGRLKPDSVIDCKSEASAISHAIYMAWDKDCMDVVNPYGDGHAAGRIIAVLESIEDYKVLLKKHFFDYQGPA